MLSLIYQTLKLKSILNKTLICDFIVTLVALTIVVDLNPRNLNSQELTVLFRALGTSLLGNLLRSLHWNLLTLSLLLATELCWL